MDEKFIGLYNEKEAQIISKNTAYNNGVKDGKKEGFEQGIKEGIEQGIEQGKKETQIETVKKLLIKNIPITDIVEITNLSIKEIENIKKEIESIYNN